MIRSFDGHISYQDLIQLLRSNSWPGFASRWCCQSREAVAELRAICRSSPAQRWKGCRLEHQQ